jgi:tRNA threonylcarbamoyladenosine modification (KEOPS) complex  Pcc1 subunit
MRRATVRTTHGDRKTADLIAAAVRPDNTDEMQTRVETEAGTATVTTTIERDSTSGLRATVDDYVVNLQVAAQLANQDGDPSTSDSDPDPIDTT